jgi:hypothetical protein
MALGGNISTRTPYYSQTRTMQEVVSHRAVEEPPFFPNYYAERGNDKERSYIDIGSYTELGLMEQKDEGAPPALDQPWENIPSHFEFATFALMASVTLEAQDEDPLHLMGKLAPMLADSERVTKDITAANPINNGFNGVFTLYDGQPLFSQNHLLGPVVGDTGPVSNIGMTYSNLLGNIQLTPEAFNQMELLFALMLSDRGLPSHRTPIYLMCHPALNKVAREVTGSTNAPTSSDNRTNTEFEQAQVLLNRYLTNEAAWYLFAAPGGLTGGNGHALIYSSKWANSVEVWRDPVTRSWNISNMYRWTYGPADWRGLAASGGAGPTP